MIRTLKDFWYELGTLSYDSGDYALIRSKFRDNEIDASCRVQKSFGTAKTVPPSRSRALQMIIRV